MTRKCGLHSMLGVATKWYEKMLLIKLGVMKFHEPYYKVSWGATESAIKG